MSEWLGRGGSVAGAPSLRLAAGLIAPFSMLLWAGPGAAQAEPPASAERLFETCAAGASPALVARCGDAALALQAMHGGIGLLMTAGGPVPASPSTIGRRLADRPRVVVDGGAVWSSFRHPDISGPPGEGGARDRRSLLAGARFTTGVGIFEGFSPIPTVGGVLAVDLLGTARYLRLPESDGFSGSAGSWGGGVRLGVVRESFTLPGVTLSAMHHRTGRVRYGDATLSGAGATLRPRATSVRGVVGKDLLAVGLSGGFGWDRYGGVGSIEASVPGAARETGPEDLRMTRHFLFAGANFTWVVAQFAGEVVWARTTSPIGSMEGTGQHRPGARELQGAFTFRVTY